MQSETEEDLLNQVAAHAKSAHPEMAAGKSDEELKEMARPMIVQM